ncbi:hypothetical protein Tco_0630723 [Tanacetum coccineum]
MTLRAQETCMIWLGHIGGLEGDDEGLVDVLVKLETSFDEVFTPFDAAASTRRNKKIMIAICRLSEPVNFSYARNVVHRDIDKGASFTQRTISSIPIGGSISPEGFLLPVLLLVVIIVTVVIVIVILIVVVDDVSLILKLSFTRVPSLRLLALAIAAVCAFRAAVKSAVSYRMASKVMAGVSDVDVLLGGILST